MEIKERITRAKIQIQKSSPFFAYLSLYLKVQEDKNLEFGIGVDIKGNLYYKEDFVKELSDSELKGVLIHEILHLSLLHLIRRSERDNMIWNIACDIVVNQIIKNNGYKLPSGCLISDDEEIFRNGDIIIDNCNKKTAEEIYDELLKYKEKQKESGSGGNGNKSLCSELNSKRFDEHKSSKGISEKKMKELEKDWINKTTEAIVSAKMRRDIPKGMEILIEKLHESKVNWKALLQRYITSSIPYDYSYNYPQKKSISLGYYSPDYVKEKIDIVVGIDLSGSIGKRELEDFISEIVGIAKAYRNKINFRLLTHDCKVHNDYRIENGNINKIKELKLNGGGGTSHKDILDLIKLDRNCKISIFFTDGDSDLNSYDLDDYRFEKIFIISKDGTDRQIINKKCRIIKL